MKQYQVITRRTNTAEDFSEFINIYISQGWQPIGGVAVNFDNATGQFCYHQALVK